MSQAHDDTELDALDVPHPSPHRKRVPMWLLVAPLFAPPVLWVARLSFSYGLIAATCGPATVVDIPLAQTSSTAWVAVAIVNVLSIVVMGGMGIISQRIWKRVGGEDNHPRSVLLDIGEGRASFMAHWGILVSYGFMVVTIFDSLAMVFLPVCSG